MKDLEQIIATEAHDFGMKIADAIAKAKENVDAKKAIIYRLSPDKHAQLRRVAQMMTATRGNRVSLQNALDEALNALEQKLNQTAKRRKGAA